MAIDPNLQAELAALVSQQDQLILLSADDAYARLCALAAKSADLAAVFYKAGHYVGGWFDSEVDAKLTEYGLKTPFVQFVKPLLKRYSQEHPPS